MYRAEDDDFEYDEPERPRPLVLVHQITDELKADYVALIADGYDPGSAAKELGSTGTQFRKLRSPASQWYDPAFADQVATALASPGRRDNILERLEEATWRAIDDGNTRMLEKMLLAYHPDFEKLRHSNLTVKGEIVHVAKALLPHLSTEEIKARLSDIEQKEGKPVALLPPPSEDKAA